MLLVMLACSGFGQPCNDCDVYGDFMEACLDDLTEAGVSADCVLDAPAYIDWADGGYEEDWEDMVDAGVVKTCETAAEAEDSCNAVHSERWSRLDSEERAEEEETCHDVDELDQLMLDKDCQGFVDALFGPS